ncbi:MAG: hypothetical protein ABIV51_08885 [Saprospiraceae bacterium]
MKASIFILSLMLTFSFQACKQEPKASDEAEHWKEVKFDNALDAAHSIENREGWIPSELVPSGVDIHAAHSAKDSVMFMTYRIGQQSEIEILAKYITAGAVPAEEYSLFNKYKPEFSWWPTADINQKIKGGKLLLGKAYNTDTKENVYYGLDREDGQLYSWKNVYVLRDMTAKKSSDSTTITAPVDTTVPPAAPAQ